MILSEKDIRELADIALLAAISAGQLIINYKHQNITILNKSKDKSLGKYNEIGESYASRIVTEVDFLSQDIILQKLQPTCESYNLALLTEENPDSKERLVKDYFWCIDPLDGTLPFTEGKSGYAISIALVSKHGVPTIGVIHDPKEGVTYHAIKNEGAFRNGRPWYLNESDDFGSNTFTFITDRNFAKHQLINDIEARLKTYANAPGSKKFKQISHGGAAMNACWVLENSPACYFKFPKQQVGGGSLWDYAASTCIFNEMGAVASDIYGDRLELNRESSTFLNHKGILYATNRHLAKFISDLYKDFMSDK